MKAPALYTPAGSWCQAVLAAALCGAASASYAQTRAIGLEGSQQRIEIINERIASPPRMEPDQMQSAPAIASAVTPHALTSNYVRQLEQYAQGQAGASKPAAVKSPAEAAWILGLMQLHGTGTGLNPVSAREWFQHAQRLHYPLASAGLAWCYLDGCGQQPEPEAARPWIAQLRKADNGRALYLEWYLAQLVAPLQVATPTTPQVTPRQPSALLLRASRAGDTYAENELGIWYAEGGDLIEAKRLFQLAAKDSPAAKANIDWIERQKTTNTAPITGVASGASPHGQDLFLRARQFHRGDGVPIDYTQAISLYRQAAAQGNRFAQKMLALIYTRPTPSGSIDIVWMQQLASIDVTKEGGTSMLAPPPSPLLQRDPTPLFDYLPRKIREEAMTDK